jgi:hypothetical protein
MTKEQLNLNGFKIGDTVFLGQRKGLVISCNNDVYYPIIVEFEDNKRHFFTLEGGTLYLFNATPALSFTPYDVIKTNTGFNVVGFTQERPHEFKQGDVVLVQHNGELYWQLRIFVKSDNKKFVVTGCEDIDAEDYYLSYDQCKPYDPR